MPFFPELVDRVPFEGPDSRNPLAFKRYDATRIVGGRTLAEHLRFAVCYWHTFKGLGQDPFGAPTMVRPWNASSDPMRRAMDTLDAAFEFFEKLGVGLWCFHDYDLAPEGSTFDEGCANLDALTKAAERKQHETGIALLWGTANLFSHPRYQNGAATSPDPHVFAYAAAQVKHAMEATHRLGGQGYVFWGGREGYDTLLNTDLKREREQLARFLEMAADHAKAIGFRGTLMIEPKPMEPTKHQYDSDVEACLNFLREFGLFGRFKLNVETNHATLAGHTIQHELRVARLAGSLASTDANVGDTLLGWDTDQFPTDVALATYVMFEILEMGGFTTGGLNFDAKVRRASSDPMDLFYAHIGAMDAFAAGLEAAHAIREDGRLARFVEERYARWNGAFGEGVMDGNASLEDCEAYVREHGNPVPVSGRQEMLENLIAEFL
ncbi:MAG: xylose isomerase [Fimbriimonadaceae bacterium]|nr:xylose isomerase [Fimbriimonadaceae bacterium]